MPVTRGETVKASSSTDKRHDDGSHGPPSPKKKPSDVIALHMNRQATRYNLYTSDLEKVKISQFLNIGQYSFFPDSCVAVGEPLFRPNPPILEFHGYRALRTYETVLYLRNNDNVPRRCKVFPML